MTINSFLVKENFIESYVFFIVLYCFYSIYESTKGLELLPRFWDKSNHGKGTHASKRYDLKCTSCHFNNTNGFTYQLLVFKIHTPICDFEVPMRFQAPKTKIYDGTMDPKEHVSQCGELMEIVPISQHLKETCSCQGFGSTHR